MTNFRQNFIKLFLGTSLAQFVSIAFYPFLTRLYTPESFGDFGLLMSVSQIFAIVASAQIYMAIPFSESEEEARGIYSFSIYWSIFCSALLSVVMILWFLLGGLRPIFLTLPLLALSYIGNDIHKMWATGANRPGLNSIVLNVNRGIANFSKLLGSTSLGLVNSEIAANGVANLLYLRSSRKDLLPLRDVKNFWRNLIQTHGSFGFFYTIYTLSLVLSSEGLVILIKKAFSGQEAGYFFLGNKLFIQSSILLGSLISMSIVKGLAGDKILRKKVFTTLFYAFLFAVVVVLASELLPLDTWITLIFGEKWSEFGMVVRYFLLLIPLKIFSGVFAYIMVINKNMRFVSFFKMSQFGLILCMLGLIQWEFESFLKVWIAAEYLMDLIFIFLAFRKLK